MEKTRKKLIAKDTGQVIAREFYNYEGHYYLGENENDNQFSMALERENNRGYTFRCYTLCSTPTELFYSRKEYEIK